jgi:DNA modification methylase
MAEKHQYELPDFGLEAKLDGPVECLGMEFESDGARREYFQGILREKLKDPEFRKIEGFPIGEDGDILALSDPPYYTACPNPFIEDFVKHYGKPYDPDEPYRREPFAADVSEGKNDPIYNAHSYHTKVPHKAIMRYILHYTEPGDLIFDGFCGTGMTGVAATVCKDPKSIRDLGFLLNENDEVINLSNEVISRVGLRSCVICDLSPIATFVAANLNRPSNTRLFSKYARRITEDVKREVGWMFETLHDGTGKKGIINYVIWSDVLLCPECGADFVYWDEAVEYDKKHVKEKYACPHCGVALSRRELERKLETVNDPDIGKTIRRPVQVPILINYSADGKRYEKPPDKADIKLLQDLDTKPTPYPLPTEEMCFKGTDWGDLFRGYHVGTTHVHHFYTKRNRWILSAVFARIKESPKPVQNLLLAWFTGSQSRLTRLNRYMPNHGRHVGPLSGTYYLSSLPTEISPFYFLELKIDNFAALSIPADPNIIVSTNSATAVKLPDSSIDYIFTDPPFGDNLPYSELNFLWESWLRVYTNNQDEAIVSKTQSKGVPEYTRLMEECFSEYFRVLKPGRWITVEFHNSRNSVWNAIQEAIGNAGFVISDVRTLDKKKGTTKQLSYTSGAVKQDLVITAYKPNEGLEDRFKLNAGTHEGVWDFVRTHLKQLPVFVSRDSQAEVIAERQNYLLFDRMIAFHVQHGVTVPLSAAEFYTELAQRFPERDSMYFLSEQIAEYDGKRMTVKELMQLELFVSDEESAIQWLRQQLIKKPQTFQDIHPKFLQEIGGWKRYENPLELMELLEQNFLQYDGTGDVPNQIHSYLSTNFKDLRNLSKDDPTLRAKAKDRWYVPDPNKAGDLEKFRERALLREFNEYRESKQKRLRIFRYREA